MFMQVCHDVNALLWVCHDANVLVVVCHDVSVPLVHAMMRMSHWCMLWCECPFGDAMNANARLGMQWMQMSPWEYAMMWMSAWEYVMAWMSSCRYAMNANAPLVGIPWHECFDADTIYSKIPFIFKTGLPQRLKPKYSQNLICYSQKVIFLLT